MSVGYLIQVTSFIVKLVISNSRTSEMKERLIQKSAILAKKNGSYFFSQVCSASENVMKVSLMEFRSHWTILLNYCTMHWKSLKLCMFMYMWMYVCMYVCVYVCMYVCMQWLTCTGSYLGFESNFHSFFLPYYWSQGEYLEVKPLTNSRKQVVFAARLRGDGTGNLLVGSRGERFRNQAL